GLLSLRAGLLLTGSLFAVRLGLLRFGRELFLQFADDRSFDGCRSRFHVLSHFGEFRYDCFAVGAELLSDLMHTGLCHISPVSVRDRNRPEPLIRKVTHWFSTKKPIIVRYSSENLYHCYLVLNVVHRCRGHR